MKNTSRLALSLFILTNTFSFTKCSEKKEFTEKQVQNVISVSGKLLNAVTHAAAFSQCERINALKKLLENAVTLNSYRLKCPQINQKFHIFIDAFYIQIAQHYQQHVDSIKQNNLLNRLQPLTYSCSHKIAPLNAGLHKL